MPTSPRSSNQLEQIKAACDRPGSQLKFDEDHRFLREFVYAGLIPKIAAGQCLQLDFYTPFGETNLSPPEITSSAR